MRVGERDGERRRECEEDGERKKREKIKQDQVGYGKVCTRAGWEENRA